MYNLNPVTVEQFVRAVQNNLFEKAEGCKERMAMDLGVRPEQIVVEYGKRPMRFSLVQPGVKTIHLDIYDPNRPPIVVQG